MYRIVLSFYFWICFCKGKNLENHCQREIKSESINVFGDEICSTYCSSIPSCHAIFYNKTDGNCALKSRYESNFLGQEFDQDFNVYHCINHYSDSNNFVNIGKQNVTEEAFKNGYDIKMTLNGVTTFIKELSEANLEYWKAQRLCAENNGILLMELNQEITDFIISLGAPTDKRHNALFKLSSTKVLLWEDGFEEWKMDGYPGMTSCDVYGQLTEDDWGNDSLTATYLDEIGKVQFGDLDEIKASKSYCQYIGKNIAIGKPKISDLDSFPNRNIEIVNDNDWKANDYFANHAWWTTAIKNRSFKA